MKTVKVHVTEEAYEALVEAAGDQEISRTDVVSRALIAYAALSEAPENGGSFVLRNADGSVWRYVGAVEGGSGQ